MDKDPTTTTEAVLAALRGTPGTTVVDLAAATRLSRSATSKCLSTIEQAARLAEWRAAAMAAGGCPTAGKRWRPAPPPAGR
jgi:hypothetical protein